MGLDVTACSNIQYVGEGEEYEDLGYRYVYANPDFPEVADGLEEGYYDFGDSSHFRVGPYSYYNSWRRELAKMLGYTDKEIWRNPNPEIPFVKIIHFSDCEGAFGPQTSRLLYHQFAEYYDRAREFSRQVKDVTPKDFIGTYEEFLNAFMLASENGCLVFG